MPQFIYKLYMEYYECYCTDWWNTAFVKSVHLKSQKSSISKNGPRLNTVYIVYYMYKAHHDYFLF